MKIVFVSQEYPPETARGGIGSQTYAKAHGLAALGHEVYIISRSDDSERHEKITGQVTVIRIPGLDAQLPEMTEAVQWLTHSTVVAAELDALQKRVKLDIIEFPEWAAEGYIYLLNRTEWNYVPVVIQLHGPLVMFANVLGWPDKRSQFYQVGVQMEATCVQLADAVYSSSACSATWIRDYYNPQKKEIPVIHSGIDTALFSPLQVPKHTRPTILFVGRLVLNKGVKELVDAALDLSKEVPGLQLRLLGSGEPGFVRRLEEKAIRMGVPDMLDMGGYVKKEDLPTEMAKAHLFAAPSYYEGGPGFVYLEAMACGLPVIGCSGSGVEEIVTDDANGYLVPPKDKVALREALHKLLSDSDKRDSMGRQARAYVVREADTKQCVQKLANFYDSVRQQARAT